MLVWSDHGTDGHGWLDGSNDKAVLKLGIMQG